VHQPHRFRAVNRPVTKRPSGPAWTGVAVGCSRRESWQRGGIEKNALHHTSPSFKTRMAPLVQALAARLLLQLCMQIVPFHTIFPAI